MSRREELDKIFEDVDVNERKLVNKLIDEVIFLEEQMTYLKTLPFINVHPQKPQLQKTTSAAKLYKECSQSYMNAIRILVNVLRKVESSAMNELLKHLEEFS